jgi:hypothetical protein
MLSGLIAMGRGCPAVPVTTGKLEAPGPSSSRTKRPFPSKSNTSSRYYRTVSRRTEPSSCGPLMDEQPNPWWLLHHQDGPSRQRCTKPRGRFVQTFLQKVLSSKKERGLCTLARDEPVTPRVACLTAGCPTNRQPRFVRPDFRLCIPRF